MKRNLLVILLLSVIVVGLTGCGKQLTGDKVLLEYLSKEYPEEKFEIVSKGVVTIDGDIGGCDSPGKGYSYVVRSLETSVEFVVKDYYHFNSFTCTYSITDDYMIAARDIFFVNVGDSKVEKYDSCYSCLGLNFRKDNYSSKEEMVNDIWNNIIRINNTYPFKNATQKDRVILYMDIDSSDNIIDHFNLEEFTNKEKVYNIVDKLYK